MRLFGRGLIRWVLGFAAFSTLAACQQSSSSQTSATNPAGPWTQKYVGNKSSCTITEMDSGGMYYFRVRAVGPLGPGPWSDIAQKRAT